ncbi:MAG: SAM-dependent methyltransferase [Gammaproteobacteria bacterium]
MTDTTGTDSPKKGRLICIGTGIRYSEQITIVSKTYLQRADIVFGVMQNSLIDDWIMDNNPNYINMQKFYGQGKSRHQTYIEMVDAILVEVRAGKDVCCALYGHPGMYACIAHLAIGRAKEEGFAAKMEPGISAEDCLFADLGLDPGYFGCQSFEATHLLFYKHTVDPGTVLILWQISLAGEHTLKQFETTQKNLQLTVEFLSQWYDLEYEVIIYEAAVLPEDTPRIERIPLKDLPNAELEMHSTLVILPKEQAEFNQEMLTKFGITEADLGN